MSNINKTDYGIVVGDLNFDLLNDTNTHSNNYLSTLMSHGFTSYINTHTRITSNTQSCLDHIFVRSRSSAKVECNASVINTNITDHFPIYMSLNNTHTSFTKKKINYKIIRNLMITSFLISC